MEKKDFDDRQESGKKNVVEGSSINAQGNVHIGDVININQYFDIGDRDRGTGNEKVINLNKNYLKAEVQKEKVAQVIDSLLAYTQKEDEYYFNEVILLAQRWNRLNSDIRKGVITQENATISKNRITYAVLEAIDVIFS